MVAGGERKTPLQGKLDDALAIQQQLEQNACRQGARRYVYQARCAVARRSKRPDDAAKYTEKASSLKRKP